MRLNLNSVYGNESHYIYADTEIYNLHLDSVSFFHILDAR